MKYIKSFILIFLLVFVINYFGVFIYGCYSLRQSSISLNDGTFSQIIVNKNDIVVYDDYTLKNWSSEKFEQNKIDEVMTELKDVQCKKLSPLYTNLVCFLQTSYNSISEIKIDSINGKDIQYPITKDSMSKICKSGFSCEIVKLSGKVFFIIRFIDGLEPENLFTTSVYEAELEEEQIYIIESMKQSNELYKRNYPETFTHYYATPKLIGLSIVLIFVEAFLIMCLYYFIKRTNQDQTNQKARQGGKTGDGSMS